MMFIGVIIIGLIFYQLYGNPMKGHTAQSGTNAENILKERYIRGEIDEETYKRMKDTILNK
ncbi:MAG: SHOCT domain-containing protein [Clostridia bacterium]|nr:SHOCT domain-containing protein [Clostridia bacterium]